MHHRIPDDCPEKTSDHTFCLRSRLLSEFRISRSRGDNLLAAPISHIRDSVMKAAGGRREN